MALCEPSKIHQAAVNKVARLKMSLSIFLKMERERMFQVNKCLHFFLSAMAAHSNPYGQKHIVRFKTVT